MLFTAAGKGYESIVSKLLENIPAQDINIRNTVRENTITTSILSSFRAHSLKCYLSGGVDGVDRGEQKWARHCCEYAY